MYRYDSGQIRVDDFEQPIGMNIRSDNRWVQKARKIPWEAIEKRYARLFPSHKGNEAKPLRLALGACMIQSEYGYPDEEVGLQIQENPYLQYFCGYQKYDDSKPPFDPSSMVHFRKRLTVEILGEINELILRENQPAGTDHHDDDDSNRGTMIVDATCAPSNIRFPQDESLLNEAREWTEKIIDTLHDPKAGRKPRTYRQSAHKAHVNFTKCRKKTKSQIRRAIGAQRRYVKRNLKTIRRLQADGTDMTPLQQARLATIEKLYEQQSFMYQNKTHSVPDRIVSLSQPFLRPIVRGKTRSPVEFGAKLDISVVDGYARLEVLSFDAYNEATQFIPMIERFRQRTGCYPKKVLADKIYRNRVNLQFCKEHGIRLSGPRLGRPPADVADQKRLNYLDECARIEVERRFSLAKRKCGLGLIMTKREDTIGHSIAMSIVVLNLRKLATLLLRFLCFYRVRARFAEI
ncbi:MAG: IS5 family transposase [Eubacteriales bacterium]|nr:IS5 family transposase [Eubacteriales bacterium]